jgi:uncharacterized protein YoxC
MTTSMPETNDASDPAGSGGFLKRLLLAMLKVGLALLILAGLAIGAWLIFLELDRSFDAVIVRIERNTRRIEEGEAEIGVLEEQNYARQVQVADLEAALADREQEIADLEKGLSADLDHQAEMLAEVEKLTAALTAETDSLGQETAALSAGLMALQEDLNANGQQIDQLGGAVDGFSTELAALDSRSAEVQNQADELQGQLDELAAEDLAGWRRAIALFRVWEMIGRARLRLVEGNAGLAATDLELALVAVDDLLAGDSAAAPSDQGLDEPGPLALDLVTLRERLVLTAANLPDQPIAAGRDLETAWEALAAIISDALTGEGPQDEE